MSMRFGAVALACGLVLAAGTSEAATITAKYALTGTIQLNLESTPLNGSSLTVRWQALGPQTPAAGAATLLTFKVRTPALQPASYFFNLASLMGAGGGSAGFGFFSAMGALGAGTINVIPVSLTKLVFGAVLPTTGLGTLMGTGLAPATFSEDKLFMMSFVGQEVFGTRTFVPEPSTLGLLAPAMAAGTFLAASGWWRRRRG